MAPALQRASRRDRAPGLGSLPRPRCPEAHRRGRLSLPARRRLLCLPAEGGVAGFGSGRKQQAGVSPAAHTRGHRAPHPGKHLGGTAVPDWWEARAGARGRVPGEVQHPPGEHGVPRPGARTAPLLQALPPLPLQQRPPAPPRLPRHGGRVPRSWGRGAGWGDGPQAARPCGTARPSPGGDTRGQGSALPGPTSAASPSRGGRDPRGPPVRGGPLLGSRPAAPSGSRGWRGVRDPCPQRGRRAGGAGPCPPPPVPQFPRSAAPPRAAGPP